MSDRTSNGAGLENWFFSVSTAYVAIVAALHVSILWLITGSEFQLTVTQATLLSGSIAAAAGILQLRFLGVAVLCGGLAGYFTAVSTPASLALFFLFFVATLIFVLLHIRNGYDELYRQHRYRKANDIRYTHCFAIAPILLSGPLSLAYGLNGFVQSQGSMESWLVTASLLTILLVVSVLADHRLIQRHQAPSIRFLLS